MQLARASAPFGSAAAALVVSLSITFQTERHDHDDDVAPIMATLVAVAFAVAQFAQELAIVLGSTRAKGKCCWSAAGRW